MNIDGINKQNIATRSGLSGLSELKVTAKQTNGLATPVVTTQSQQQEGTESAASVSISAAGRKALASELGSTLHDKSALEKAKAQAEAEKTPKKPIDELLETLKEQVEKLKQALKALEGDKSEAAQKKREQIQTQITVLMGQISTLTIEKLKQDEQAARANR
ncbi:hypothetical protein [Shewanella colwelliana]|uniref:hypothetical protein n=1 Tax=Shewanella colwelliana TaxID=23 RepID=UPI00373573FD